MNVLMKPIITEKAIKLSEVENKYTFVVLKSANKIQIKIAVEEKYGVSIESVNTMNYAPKKKLKHTKRGVQKGRSSAYKKAVVLISEDQSIDFYSNL